MAVETKTEATPKKTAKEIQKMSHLELMDYARELGISNVAGMTHRELLFETGGSPEGTAIYDRKKFYDPDDIRDERAANRQVPGRTIYWEKDREAVEKIIAKQPWAFNNYDLTDPTRPIKFIFKREKNVTCNRGHKLQMPSGKDRVVCPVCREEKVENQVIYIDPDKEV